MEIPTDFKSIATIMLAVGGIGGIIGMIKGAPIKIWEHIKHKFITTITIYDTDQVYEPFEEWFFKNYSHKFTNIQLAPVLADDLPATRESNEKSELKFGQKEGYFFVKYKNAHIYINKGKIDRKESNRREAFLNYYELSSNKKETLKEFIRGLFIEKTKDSNVNLYSNNMWGDWNFIQKLQNKTLSSVILPEGQVESVIKDMQEFIDAKDWYFKRAIPYSRGYLFYGEPGNGKTSLIIALAEHLKKPLYSLDLSTLEGDNELKQAFRYMPSDCIVSLEDIDKAFRVRENQEVKGITFSCLLNCLDGVFQKTGVIIVMTTNHIESLDPALIRDGRVDFRLEIFNPYKKEVEKYLSVFYETPVTLDSYDQNYSMAELQGICLKNKNNLANTLRYL